MLTTGSRNCTLAASMIDMRYKLFPQNGKRATLSSGRMFKVLQYEVYRLFSNLSALREMKKHGRKVGKLRFKPANRFRTFTHNQSGFDLLPKNEKFSFLRLSKIGDIPIRLHREVVGNIKGVTIKHMPSGKWYMYILVDDSDGNDKLTVIDKTVGIDLGLEHFIVDSDGNEIENSQHIRRRYA